MLHRHVWSNGTFSAWHDATRTHTGKGPDGLYENDLTFETREAGAVKGRAKKAKAPEYSFNEYGEPVVSREPTAGELEYAFLMEATTVASSAEAVKEAVAIVAA